MADMHTPLKPYHAHWDGEGGAFVSANGSVIADMVGPIGGRKANAELIVTALNERLALLARPSQDAETIKALREIVLEGVAVTLGLSKLVSDLSERLDVAGVADPDAKTIEAHFELFDRVDAFIVRSADLAGSAS